MVLNNCLVKRFLSYSNDESLNFYPPLVDLLSLIDDKVSQNAKLIERLESKSVSGMKEQLASSAKVRQAKASTDQMIKMRERAELKVSLMETEIRDLMDKCLQDHKSKELDEFCTGQIIENQERAQELCSWLKIQGTLLLAAKFN